MLGGSTPPHRQDGLSEHGDISDSGPRSSLLVEKKSRRAIGGEEEPRILRDAHLKVRGRGWRQNYQYYIAK
jgi:hypothetical protein